MTYLTDVRDKIYEAKEIVAAFLDDRAHEIDVHLERAYAAATEAVFIEILQKENHFGLVDDGTLDTVLSCPKCNWWLCFDGRDAAIDFLEDDRECWLCPESEAPQRATHPPPPRNCKAC